MGYYHGYKRFKFIKNKENQQSLKYFSEIQEMHKFDLELKKLFYPMLIEVETGLKNRVIDCLVTDDNPDIEYIRKSSLITKTIRKNLQKIN
ncbi:Abi family protein [Enterococcus sp. AZ078]|uniref:Abi family protein n=1 Tax=Enterococcus sp. AZ078 TaxID=2774710 RepID=UPI003B91568B